jgi:hypothetical protein
LYCRCYGRNRRVKTDGYRVSALVHLPIMDCFLKKERNYYLPLPN